MFVDVLPDGRAWSTVGSSEFGIACWEIRHRKSDKRVVFGFGLLLKYTLQCVVPGYRSDDVVYTCVVCSCVWLPSASGRSLSWNSTYVVN